MDKVIEYPYRTIKGPFAYNVRTEYVIYCIWHCLYGKSGPYWNMGYYSEAMHDNGLVLW